MLVPILIQPLNTTPLSFPPFLKDLRKSLLPTHSPILLIKLIKKIEKSQTSVPKMNHNTIPQHNHHNTIPQHNHHNTIPQHNHHNTVPQHNHHNTIAQHDHYNRLSIIFLQINNNHVFNRVLKLLNRVDSNKRQRYECTCIHVYRCINVNVYVHMHMQIFTYKYVNIYLHMCAYIL
jgi:hypothetical protein